VALNQLNDPISEDEVVNALQAMNNNKTTVDGFPAEIFKYAIYTDPETKNTTHLLAKHLQAMFNTIFVGGSGIPESWHTSHLIPIYKGKGAKDDLNSYRGITITCCLYKIYTMILNTRLDTHCETFFVRALTQCGFRKQLGTITALFTLHHAIHTTCTPISKGGLGIPLITCFIDFSKAFDSVWRDLIWKRLRSIGVHGHMLHAIMDLYKNTRFVIKVNGKTSKGFIITLSGVKQGCPLSPLLFGLFIEQLHDIMKLQCPGIGIIIISEDRLHDVLYADDLLFLSYTTTELQCLCDCLASFCTDYHMEVNVGKTEIVVFYPSNHPIISPCVMFNGTPLSVKNEFKYLGLLVNDRTWFKPSAESMASSARHAMWAMVDKFNRLNIISMDIKTRLFSILVESVGCYGCQVWGIDYLKVRTIAQILDNPLQKTLLSFLRLISGCYSKVCRMSLLKEFGFLPYQVKWARLCARFWNANRTSQNLEGIILQSDIMLFKRGSVTCWAAKFLCCMVDIGLLTHTLNHLRSYSLSDIQNFEFHEESITTHFTVVYAAFWPLDQYNPRTAPRRGAAFNKYITWFLDPDTHSATRQTTPPAHITTIMPDHEVKTLIKFRLGSCFLKCDDHSITDRMQRHCPCCDSGLPEDEYHLVFECPAYNHLRSSNWSSIYSSCENDLNAFINQQDQARVARFICTLLDYRKRLLLGNLPQHLTTQLDMFNSDSD
jgi:hypothetical protein